MFYIILCSTFLNNGQIKYKFLFITRSPQTLDIISGIFEFFFSRFKEKHNHTDLLFPSSRTQYNSFQNLTTTEQCYIDN